jgi:hypothetical protein
MDTMVLRIFQREVERQCKFAIMATQDLNLSLQEPDMDRIWYSVQALLVAVGNVSKLLWPPNPKLTGRGAQLRASLSVSDDSPLAPPRVFRNHFEHFDERLESWATSSERGNFVDSNVGPPGMIAGIDPKDFMRNFDTQNLAVTFRGETYPLQPVADAISELWPKVATEAAKPHWETHEGPQERESSQ